MDATVTAVDELQAALRRRPDDHESQPPDSILGRRLDRQDGPTHAGRYALLRELGRGAIGVVYAAYHEGLDRKLAIKLLNPQRARRADLEARLRREARALAKLSHPNVVQVYDVGEFEGRVFVAMEFVDGQTLGDWMRAEHEVDEIVAMFAEAGRGLAAAHEAGVIHRDFKPDNVLVGRDNRPRVLDFGLACPIEPIAFAELSPAQPDTEGEPASFGTSLDQLLRTGELGDGERRPLPRAGRRHDPDATEDSFTPRAPGDDNERSQDGIATQTNVARPPDRDAELDDTLSKHPPAANDYDDDEDEDDVITRTGALMGTPAYMSPEQFVGRHVDAASDQFSFCVALHEALYGHRPFIGKSAMELGIATGAGEIVEAPPNSRVPLWLREVIVRGLDPAPERRFASMNELIAALACDPEVPKRRWWLGLVGAGIGVLAFAVGMLAPERASPCPTLAESAARVWTPARGAELREAFTRSELPYADATWSRVEPRLQAWAQTWGAQRVNACEATVVRHEFSPEVLTLREACLDRASRGYEALLGQLGAGAPRVIERASEATAALPDPEKCGDIDALLSAARPEGPAKDSVEQLRADLAELDMRIESADADASLPVAEDALERARELGYGPVVAEAMYIHGRLLANTDALARAIERLQDALDEAERSDADALVPKIALELVRVSLARGDAPLQARVWARRAATGLDRLGKRDLDQARALWLSGRVALVERDAQAAGAELLAAIALLDELAPIHPSKPAMLVDLSRARALEGRIEDAREALTGALAASLNAFGPVHPRVGDAHYELARFEFEQGRQAATRKLLDQAARVYVDALGRHSEQVGHVESLRARLELDAGQLDLAQTHATHAAQIYADDLATNELARAETHLILGHVALARRHVDGAIEQYREALAIQQSALPPGDPAMARTHSQLGLAYLASGEPGLAIQQLQRCVELLEADEPTLLQRARIDLGEALLARGAPDDARRAGLVFAAAFAGCEGVAAVCEAAALGAEKASAVVGDAAGELRWRERATRGRGRDE
ncbi:Serine/threonine protein kinase [Enhygromyxa salina]|uniref:Serine/threonine protein kinase n=1 Tax=Enhygromyxa salina TaxID=215803 RepID=A0A0C1ZXS2_9BACT|nr:serine/threonine-protein kinase [Enhygromyxa salina]KIG16018.1 Serine/threonine protein kinase [Enhygromyxa salina]